MKSKRDSYNIQLSPPNGVKALTYKQQRLARRYADLMQYVAGGAQRAISECQQQFQKRRWNCSAHNPENVFGNILKIGKRNFYYFFWFVSSEWPSLVVSLTLVISQAAKNSLKEALLVIFNTWEAISKGEQE